MNIKNISDLVKDLLQRDPKTRSSDSFLYARVCEEINPEVSFLQFRFVMENRKDLELPGFETVRRSRQKLQQHHPELAAVADVEAGRMVREEEFRDYARKATV